MTQAHLCDPLIWLSGIDGRSIVSASSLVRESWFSHRAGLPLKIDAILTWKCVPNVASMVVSLNSYHSDVWRNRRSLRLR